MKKLALIALAIPVELFFGWLAVRMSHIYEESLYQMHLDFDDE